MSLEAGEKISSFLKNNEAMFGCNFLYFLAFFDNKKVVKLRSLTKRVNFDKYQVRKKQGNCGINLSLAYN